MSKSLRIGITIMLVVVSFQSVLIVQADQPTTKVIPNAAKFKILKYKDRGKEVLELQKKLIQLGYLKNKPTEYFGELTLNAVKAFQKNNGLKITSVFDEKTSNKLISKIQEKNKGTSATVPLPSSTSSNASEENYLSSLVSLYTTKMSFIDKR